MERIRGDQGRHASAYRDYLKLHREGLLHAEQRSAQHGHDEIEQAASALLECPDG